MLSILDLPADLLEMILALLSGNDVAALQSTCKTFYELSTAEFGLALDSVGRGTVLTYTVSARRRQRLCCEWGSRLAAGMPQSVVPANTRKSDVTLSITYDLPASTPKDTERSRSKKTVPALDDLEGQQSARAETRMREYRRTRIGAAYAIASLLTEGHLVTTVCCDYTASLGHYFAEHVDAFIASLAPKYLSKFREYRNVLSRETLLKVAHHCVQDGDLGCAIRWYFSEEEVFVDDDFEKTLFTNPYFALNLRPVLEYDASLASQICERLTHWVLFSDASCQYLLSIHGVTPNYAELRRLLFSIEHQKTEQNLRKFVPGAENIVIHEYLHNRKNVKIFADLAAWNGSPAVLYVALALLPDTEAVRWFDERLTLMRKRRCDAVMCLTVAFARMAACGGKPPGSPADTPNADRAQYCVKNPLWRGWRSTAGKTLERIESTKISEVVQDVADCPQTNAPSAGASGIHPNDGGVAEAARELVATASKRLFAGLFVSEYLGDLFELVDCGLAGFDRATVLALLKHSEASLLDKMTHEKTARAGRVRRILRWLGFSAVRKGN